MKKIISILLALVIVLSCAVLFASCKSEESTPAVEEYTSSNNQEVVTEAPTTEETKYSVMGGSEPYVEDIF